MKCNTKTNIYAHAMVATEGTTENIKTHILTADQFYERLDNSSAEIGEDNYEEIVKTKKLIKNALKRIPRFKDMGIVIPGKSSHLSTVVNNLINKLMIHKEQAVNYVNSTLPESLVLTEDGSIITDKSEEDFDKAIKRRLSPYVNTENRKYVHIKNGKVIFDQQFVDDYNEMRYVKYLKDIGFISSIAVDNAPEEYMDATMELRKTPILAHISTMIRGTTQKLRKLKKSPSYSPTEAALLETDLRELRLKQAELRDKMTFDMLQEYIENILATVERDLTSGLKLDRNTINAHLKSLELVINGADTRLEVNPILKISEIKTDEIIDIMLNYSNSAVKLRNRLEEIATVEGANIAKEVLGDKIEDTFKDLESFKVVKQLSKSYQRLMHNVLGLHHVQNPIVQALHKLVERASITANIITRDENNKIEELHKATIASGFDVDKFKQLDQDRNNLMTGRLVDVFSARFWTMQDKFYRDVEFRDKYALHLNPYVLFELDETDPNRIRLENQIYEYMGEETGKERIEAAKELWDKYNLILQDLIDSGASDEAINRFKLRNDPVYRIQNFKATDKKRRGSDAFLLFIPKKYNEKGQNLGFYDDAFKEIMNSPTASEYYKYVRKIFIKNQEDLGKFEEKFKPPQLAYIDKSVAELLARGDYLAAGKLSMMNAKKTFSPVESTKQMNYPKDPISGRYQPKLQYETHTVYAEVRNRVDEKLKNDATYNAFDKSTMEGVRARREYRERIRVETMREVEAESSQDLLQSIVMANYSTREFIERRAVQTEVNLIKYLIDNEIIKTDASEKEQDKKSMILLKNLVEHFLDVAYYDRRDQSASSTFDDTKDKKRGVTTRALTKAAINFSRVAVLGWSLPVQFANLGQQFMSTTILAAEGKNFKFGDVLGGYNNIVTKGKDRALIDKLFILGDVAYAYKKRTIHEQNKLWAKLHPMYLQTFTEKINQGAISIAILKSLKVKDAQGNEVSLYDALDDKGNLSEEYSFEDYKERGVDLMARITVSKIRPVVMKSAGDYLSPLLLEKSEFGKLGLMFKKWLPEMLMDRFGGRRYDYVNNKEVEGRLLALGNGLVQMLTGRRDEIDVVRMNAMIGGIKEIMIVMMTKILFYALAAGYCDTKKCKEKNRVAVFGLNTLGRVADDAFSLMNPYDIIGFGLNPFAIKGTIDEFMKFSNNLTSALIPGGDDGRYKQKGFGHEKGDLKFLSQLERIVPFYRTNGYRLKLLSSELQYNPIVSSLIESK